MVVPAWLPVPTLPSDDIVIRIDPGRAFGSGSHPSTGLAIAALEDRLTPGDRVLDVGTGSGVLAVAACRLGARLVLGIDLDPEALAAAPRNAVLNDVGGRVDVAATPLATIDETFDIVLANIGLGVLLELAPDLERLVRPGGWLVLSGLLEPQADAVVAALPRAFRRSSGWPLPDGWRPCSRRGVDQRSRFTRTEPSAPRSHGTAAVISSSEMPRYTCGYLSPGRLSSHRRSAPTAAGSTSSSTS